MSDNSNDDLQKEHMVKGRKASSSARSWYEFSLLYVQETPKRLEEASKFLSGILTLFISITLKDIDIKIKNDTWMIYIAGAFAVLSLILSVLVFIPTPFHYVEHSPSSIKAAHQKNINKKYYALLAAFVFFVLHIGIVIGIIIYNK